MKIGIHSNKRLDPQGKITQDFVSSAINAGFTCGGVFDLNNVEKFAGLNELAAWSDIIAVIGGDGTVLTVAEAAARNEVPILPVHNGSLGFLTEIKMNEVKEALGLISEKKYDIEQRGMIETVFNGETHIALNEILIARINRSSVCRLSAYCDDVYFDTYIGDGVIVSTPTGSTGYSLSAGGPVISPKLDAIVLTPLCVHALNNRSIVFNGNETIRIKIDGRDDLNCILVDGRQLSKKVKVGMSLEIKKSNFKTSFIRFSGKSFYARMYSKLESWNCRS